MGVPATGVAAVLLNVTATGADGPGFVTVFPGGAAVPLASNLNVSGAGQTIPNLALGSLGTGGTIGLYSLSGTDLVVDVAGWFSGPPGRSGPARAPGCRPNSALANSFRVVYALPSDVPADPAIVAGIPHEIDLVAGWFAGQTGGHQPRFYAPGGTLAVDTVDLGDDEGSDRGGARSPHHTG